MMVTFKSADILVGYHPDGYRIDNTESAMNLYTKWEIINDEWVNSKPVCFDSLPIDGWLKTDSF